MLYETVKLRLKLSNRESAKNPNLVHVPTESSVRKSCTTTRLLLRGRNISGAASSHHILV